MRCSSPFVNFTMRRTVPVRFTCEIFPRKEDELYWHSKFLKACDSILPNEKTFLHHRPAFPKRTREREREREMQNPSKKVKTGTCVSVKNWEVSCRRRTRRVQRARARKCERCHLLTQRPTYRPSSRPPTPRRRCGCSHFESRPRPLHSPSRY